MAGGRPEGVATRGHRVGLELRQARRRFSGITQVSKGEGVRKLTRKIVSGNSARGRARMRFLRHNSGVQWVKKAGPRASNVVRGPVQDAPLAHLRPGYPSVGCAPAEPTSVSPGRTTLYRPPGRWARRTGLAVQLSVPVMTAGRGVASVRREKPSFPEYATTAIAIATPHGRRARSATPWRSLVRPRGAHRERSRSRQGPFLPPQ
jgi:hypothetical protein